MESDPPPLPDNATLILGPPLVGIVLNWWLYGILVVQYFVYLSNDRQDKKVLRIVVHFLLLLDTAQTFMTLDDVFVWYVYNFNNYSSMLEDFNLAPIDGPLLDATIMFTVQIMYCWRLWVFGRWKVIPTIAALLTLISCVSGMFIGIIDMIVDPVTQADRFDPVEELWLCSSAVTDILIASSMIYQLTKYRTEHATERTKTIVMRILILTLETNAMTAVVAIALVISLLVPQIFETNVYVTFGYIIGKMYSNCFMVLLNQRIYYSTMARAAEDMGTSNSSYRGVMPLHDNDTLSSQDQNTGQMSPLRFTETTSDATRTMVDTSGLETVCGIHETKDGQESKTLPRDFV